MKTLIIGLLSIVSASSFAQHAPMDSVAEAMEKLVEAHNESPGLEAIKQEVEQKYGVKCEGSTATYLPGFTKQITYSAKCKGEKSVKLKISSKFKSTRAGYTFEVKSYKIVF